MTKVQTMGNCLSNSVRGVNGSRDRSSPLRFVVVFFIVFKKFVNVKLCTG